MARHFEHHLPVPGGLLEQSNSFVDAVDLIRREKATIELESLE